jgi:hypothetical protein
VYLTKLVFCHNLNFSFSSSTLHKIHKDKYQLRLHNNDNNNNLYVRTLIGMSLFII